MEKLLRGFFKLLLIFGVVFFVCQTTALACGSLDMWADFYERGERHKALFHMLDCADSYKVPQDDLLLLPIIKDALQRDPEVAKLAEQVFENYNHLWGARLEPDYAIVLEKVSGESDYKKLDQYRDWYWVTAKNGANMRTSPSLQGRVVTAVKYGMQVKVISQKGEWIKARPVGPGAIDPRFENKSGYIHRSLVKKY
ncbi:SH3 domain-containing protein [Dethiosulfatarculus sandiegensis]|uniref:SH3b domain-containing protein n=1 Tax=Dethiosulfatarculus sandiegensis TaxID=1429043 RepID=A0A0D2J967_9BACT|nr:SH3 domain-containing protein [Dethiosulfatarculus sandiegensis]KIX14704.1 hypothetical protein X474_07355 [Dethiosulfatarculus sandiegensis]